MSLADRTPPRYRETDSYNPTFVVGIWGNGVGGSGSFTKTGGSSGSSKLMWDEPHPHFFARKKRGELIWGDLILYTSERSYADGLHNTGIVPHTGGYWSESVGDFAALVERVTSVKQPVNSGDLETMKSVAMQKAYASMNQASLLGLEVLNDIDKTVGMLHKPFKSSLSLLGKMSKYKAAHLGKTAASAAKATANAWLEYRYGWKPILLDCDTVIEQAHKLRRKTDRRTLVARATEKSTATAVTSFTLQPMAEVSSWLADGSVTRKIELRACAGVIYDCLSQTATEQLQKVLGLRPRDITASAWEVIPYSFVADWFVGVGTWLEAVTPNPYVSVRGRWVTTVEERTDDYSGGSITEYHYISNWPVYTSHGNWGGSHMKYVTVRRDCNPLLTFTPEVKVKPLSLLHSADAMSLALNPVLDALKKLKH